MRKRAMTQRKASVTNRILLRMILTPAVSVGLVGVRNEWELKENVAAVEWTLSEDIREEINTVFSDEDVPTHADTEQAI